jgi:pimeloyl-ACP methyl ester carboxylesterase
MRRPPCASRGLFLAGSFRAAIVVLIAAGSGCVSQMLTKAIVQAPNRRGVPYVLRPEGAKQLQRDDQTYAEAWMLPVGPPAAKLAVAVIEPGNYAMVHSIEVEKLQNGRAHAWPKTEWKLPASPLPGSPPAKATILILHGYSDTKEDMVPWAIYLAQAGYRAVLVDMRGHGRSTGDWIGYGVFEVHDLGQVLDDLQRKGLAMGPVGVLGLSYGASVALQLAGHDKRVGTVVALEPFSDARRAVVEFAHAVVPGYVEDWTDKDFSVAEDRAGRMANFSWQDADVMESVGRATAPVLYVVASKDHWISPENTRLLAAKTRGPHSEMTITFDGGGLEDHVRLSWTLDPIAPVVVKWLDGCLLNPGPGLGERLAALGFPQ